MEGGQDAIVGGRIAGVVSQARRTGVPAVGDLGVVLGPSAVNMGIDPALLEAEAGPGVPAHWLTLYANGANASDLHGLSELLLGSGLQPRILVLGIHPSLLARSDHYLSDETRFDLAPLQRALTEGKLRALKTGVETLLTVPMNRAFPNRTRVSHHIRGLAAEAKRHLFAALGLGADSLYAPDRDPWAVRLLVAEEDASSDLNVGRRVFLRDQPEGPMREGPGGEVKDKGWNDPACYSNDGANAHALVSIVREVRARGITVVLLLLPEASKLRAQIPPEAMTCLNETLQKGFGDNPPPLINLREALPDSLFHDTIHPNREGRRRRDTSVGRCLAEAVKTVS